ncbi:4116_t:CDS:2, partial [Dentiscutata heterogama]
PKPASYLHRILHAANVVAYSKDYEIPDLDIAPSTTDINLSLKEAVRKECNIFPLTVVILEARPAPN